jgi:glutamyl-Q tRNA(Asp) synthetase
MSGCTSGTRPTGRFAPSPTGDLHFGSLIAAVASFLQARTSGGRWLVRIENIDPPREVEGSAERILRDLESFGLVSDLPVVWQGDRTKAYRAALERLLASGQAFHCGCSRSDLPPGKPYPGTCRNGLAPGKQARSVRLRVKDETIRFTDRIQGEQLENLAATVGDFVIWRADGLPAYQLAVVVDDAWQQVTEIVRGTDLLGSTARQIQLFRSLQLPVPAYAHHPVAVGPDGQKLSKQTGSDPVHALPREQALECALRFLGQDCPSGLGLDELWRWALQNWRLDRVPSCEALPQHPDSPGN